MTAEPVILNRAAPPLLPPHSTEAEECVIGSCLIDPYAISTIADLLSAEDFYGAKLRSVYAAMEALHARQIPTDFVMVCEELERADELEKIGGVGTLTGALTSVPTSVHVEYYAGIVADTATRRRLISAGTKIVSLGYDESDDLDHVLAQADQILGKVTRRRGSAEWVSITDASVAYLESIQTGDEQPTDGPKVGAVPTGLIDLDHLLGGLYAGDLTILAARPGFGKSAMALGIGTEIALKQGLTVALFTLEMSRLQIAGRLLSALADVDVARLREGRIGPMELQRIADAIDRLEGAPLWIDDRSGLSLRELEIRARRLHAEHPINLLIVDYLQLVNAPGANRVQSIGAISRSLKALAGDLGCPVLALSQLSRAVESRPGHQPQLSDLRESGDLEQDADVVMFIAREDQYDRETERKGICDIHVAKHRNGPTGVVNLLFLERSARFVDLGMGGR